jgi:hypothetical protein
VGDEPDAAELRCATGRLSLADIDELARLQRKILDRSVLVDELLEHEKFQGKSGHAHHGSLGGLTTRDALAGLLDDMTDAARRMAAIVNRDDQGGAT